jgi:phytoene dehydrogenase-like protein
VRRFQRHPRALLALLPESKGDWRDAFSNYQSESATLRMNVALSELPDFSALRGIGPHLSSGIIMAPSLAFMDRAFTSAREEGWSREPIVEMLIPSTVDDSLAPRGQHVASLFCQHFRYALARGTFVGHGARARGRRRDRPGHEIRAQFQGVRAGPAILTPLDLERQFGLVGGDIFHGKLTLNQLFSARPVLGYSAYRMPLKGLYLCGSGAHPGGGVTGVAGA